MAWTIKFTEIAAKQFKKLNKSIAKELLGYLKEKVAKQKNPMTLGKPLLLLREKSGLWRYRVKDYRIICRIEDKELTVLVIRVGHGKEVYD